MINLHAFLQSYFTAHHCQIHHDQDGVLTVQLTEEMDKALMNRPFYWHYIKSLGNPGEPAELTLITNPDQRNQDGEWIHFGSPRIKQMFNHLKQTSGHIKLFQKKDTIQNIALYPWLVTNIKISYQGKQNKEELFSIGLNLINGMMKTNMMSLLEKIPLHKNISDYCYPLSPMIKLNSGFMRITTVIEDYFQKQPFEWAHESILTLKEEINMVEHFYKNDHEHEKLEKEIAELKKLYEPTIAYQVINGGLVYLAEDAI